jgi:serine/threonine-protein kinase
MATCPTCGASYTAATRICTRDGTVLPADPPAQDPQIGRVLDGKYRLEAILGHGGMGSLYRATHIMLGKPVAVKLIKPDLVTSPDIVARFQREARAASNLNHPNIVTVHDLGQADDGTLYIAMELIDGPSLKDVIRSSGPMPTARIVAILGDVAGALALAHSHNIIHRDLKPQNIMLASGTGRRQIAKLLDFGIAKTFDDSSTQLTRTGFTLGTPQYMAPEQAAGTEVDARADLYSLGVILYEMLTGEVPFTDPSTPALLVKLMTEAPEPPSRRRPGAAVSPALEAIALRCLEKDPARRFDSAGAFADALSRVDAGVEQTAVTQGPTLVLPSTPAPAPSMATRAASSVRPAPPAAAAAHAIPARPVDTTPTPSRSRPALWAGVTMVVALTIGILTYRFMTVTPPEEAATAGADAAPLATATAPLATAAAPVQTPPPPDRPAEGAPASVPSPEPPASAAPETTASTPPLTTPPSPSPPRETANTAAAPPAQAAEAPPRAPASAPAPLAAEVENPPVLFQCSGEAEVCAAVRSALDRALERNNLPSVRNAGRAAIIVTAAASVVQERVSRDFGTPLATRTYSVDVSGETREGDVVAMPAARTFSYDAQFGRARLEENAGLIADEVVERVRAFWARRRR